jgi:hypothetical protein
VQLKHWKRGRIIYRELVAHGMPSEAADGLPPTAGAGGTTRRWRSTWRCRTISSNGWESPNLPVDLNPSNRPVRTRMPGGVAGDAEISPPRPYADSGTPRRNLFEGIMVRSRNALKQLKPTLTLI